MEMTTYETYIFDLDGTLLDSLEDLKDGVNHALRLSGLPERTIDEVRGFVGNGVGKLVERSVPGGKDNCHFPQVMEDFNSYYLLHSCDKTQPYPGVTDLLGRLRSDGKRVAVVSNKFDEAVKLLIARYFNGLVEVAIGEKPGISRKPAPDTVVEALRELGADGSGAVYIGDSDVDVLTARNAGLPCISVLWGFRSREFFAAASFSRSMVRRPLFQVRRRYSDRLLSAAQP